MISLFCLEKKNHHWQNLEVTELYPLTENEETLLLAISKTVFMLSSPKICTLFPSMEIWLSLWTACGLAASSGSRHVVSTHSGLNEVTHSVVIVHSERKVLPSPPSHSQFTKLFTESSPCALTEERWGALVSGGDLSLSKCWVFLKRTKKKAPSLIFSQP